MTSYDQDYGPPVSSDAHRLPSIGRLVSPSIESLRAYPPGRPWRALAHELGIPESELLMLAANENVLGPSPKALEAAKRVLSEVNLYPDGAAHELKAKLAAKLSVDPARLVIGNGSNEIIELLVRTFVGPDETVVTAWPSFVVYRLATQAQGRDVILAPLYKDKYDLAALAALVDYRTKLVFIANPNNPTGTFVTRRELASFLDRIPRTVIVVIDEAYFEYTATADYPNALVDLPKRDRLVVLRTFSKAYGLAGLRVGYGVMDQELVDYVDRVRQPYNVSVVAQAAATAALEDEEHLEKSRAMVREGMQQLELGFASLGLAWIPSQANFVVVRLPVEGQIVQTELRKRGILVRAMAAYAMPDSVRITVGTKEANARVIDALSSILRATRR
jgi:histidinol-phosphate aminotransferase